MKPITVFSILLIFLAQIIQGYSQDTAYARKVINQLASPAFKGRGYVDNGNLKAAIFIRDELKKDNVGPLVPGYFQSFVFPMNTFPGKMKISLDQYKLKAVDDFVVAPSCPAIKGKFPILYLPEAADTLDYLYDSLIKINYLHQFVVAPWPHRKITRENSIHAAGVIVPESKIYWWASTGHCQDSVPVIEIKDSLLQLHPDHISVNIKNQFIEHFPTQNILAVIPGSQEPDSFIVFTAHYDHLGMMGKGNLFPGANDNASGTSMVLSLANYFNQPENRPGYSMAFLFFTGEEAGLMGSFFYAEHPVFPLSQIKMLINLDMVGSGSDGICIVNGEANPAFCSTIKSINEQKGYVPSIQIRGAACNSDQCPFQSKNVPSVFIYTKGPELMEYHNLHDVPEHFPMTKFLELERLLIEFCKQEK